MLMERQGNALRERLIEDQRAVLVTLQNRPLRMTYVIAQVYLALERLTGLAPTAGEVAFGTVEHLPNAGF